MPYDVVWYESDELFKYLSEAQEGVFHRLARHAWLHGSIPSSPAALAVIARIPVDRFMELWEYPLLEMWSERKSRRSKGEKNSDEVQCTTYARLVNKKIESERKFVENSSDKQSDRAKSGWKKRKAKKLDINATALPDQNHGSSAAMPSLSPSPSPPYPHSQREYLVRSNLPNPKQEAELGRTNERNSSGDFQRFWGPVEKRIRAGMVSEQFERKYSGIQILNMTATEISLVVQQELIDDSRGAESAALRLEHLAGEDFCRGRSIRVISIREFLKESLA